MSWFLNHINDLLAEIERVNALREEHMDSEEDYPDTEWSIEVEEKASHYLLSKKQIQQLSKHIKVPIWFVDAVDKKDGETKADFTGKVIRLNRSLSMGMRTHCIFHELTHAILHKPWLDEHDFDFEASYGIAELEAEITAAMIQLYFGNDTRNYSAYYLSDYFFYHYEINEEWFDEWEELGGRVAHAFREILMGLGVPEDEILETFRVDDEQATVA